MLPYKKILLFFLLFIVLTTGCSKLHEKLNSSLTSAETASALGAQGTVLLLQSAYVDLATPFTDQGNVFSLEENAADECLVVTRGADWDDNGVWRVLHNHSWDANHAQVLTVFNNLNKLSFDATNVLNFNPTAEQAAEAKFLRCMALYHLLDLYGQYPLRNPGDNLLIAPQVKTGADAIDFIISELNASLKDLSPSNTMAQANPDAARVLLMRALLNKGAFLNRANPTFDPADMQQVIALGDTIINSGKYSYMSNYFDNFDVVKGGSNSKEGIFAYPNQSGVSTGHTTPGEGGNGIDARWNMTLHYNSYTPVNPNAGWNGFATISDFYSAFGVTTPVTFTPVDTLLDTRIGGRYYAGATNVSGIRPGFLVGQQFNENGAPIKDRKGNPLAYTPQIASDMIERGSNLEVTGIRVVKYVPDFTNNGKYYSGPAGNWLMIFRYPEVVLMVAEAKLRTGDDAGALALVNELRKARGASLLTSLPLVNPGNVNDPNTLLSERGRELYWESVRRTDLIRFGVFLQPWQYKPSDNPKFLLYPIPAQAVAANPNLKQNPGY